MLFRSISDKPLGANYYPKDMTKKEYENADIENKGSLYTFVRRDDNGKLYSIPFHKQFKKEVKEVSNLLLDAAKLADNSGLKKYLELRAQAFSTSFFHRAFVYRNHLYSESFLPYPEKDSRPVSGYAAF